MITGKQGSVCITAMENGDVRVNGNNLVFNAKENITFKCGGNFEVDASKKIDFKSKEAYCVAPHSYGPDCIATKTNETFLTRVYAGLAAESIAVAASVGAGGIGYELQSSFRMFEYQKVSAIIIIIFITIFIIDHLSSFIRSKIK